MRTPLLVMLSMSLLLGLNSLALAAKGNKPAGGEKMERFREVVGKLNLSADQQTKVDQVLSDAETKLADAKAKAKSGNKEGARSEMQTIRQQMIGDIKKILTPEQTTTFDQELAKLREEKKADHKGATTQPQT